MSHLRLEGVAIYFTKKLSSVIVSIECVARARVVRCRVFEARRDCAVSCFFFLRVCGDDFFLSRFARNLCLKRKVKCFVWKFDGVSTSPRKRVSYSETLKERW